MVSYHNLSGDSLDVAWLTLVPCDLPPVPSMQFEKSVYKVKEKEGVLHVPVLRTGDLSSVSSVRCFTRTLSALVMDDFTERRNADESRITFLKGEKVGSSSPPA